MAAASRFVDILLDNSVPEKSKKATKYGMKIFNGKYFFLLDKTTNFFTNSRQIQLYFPR